MKYLCLGFFLFCSAWAGAKQIELDGGNITFDAPDDFTPLTPDEIAKKFPMRNGPMEALGNSRRGVSISYGFTENALQPEQLSDAQKGISDVLNRVIPGIQWLKNDIVEINGTKWIYFELTSSANDQDIHNMELATSYRGKLFVLNFNSTIKLFDIYQDKLKASLNSIKIKTNPSAVQQVPMAMQEPRTPGSSNCTAPRTRNSAASSVLPQPAPPQTSVGRPRGNPPSVISSRPWMPVGHLGKRVSGEVGLEPLVFIDEDSFVNSGEANNWA